MSALLLSGGLDLSAQTAPVSEYQVKAVFLFNFAQFVDWPPQAFPEAQTPLVIGVLGEDPFGAYLDETVRNEKVNNRPLAVQRYRHVEEIKTCHVLFISRSEVDQLEQILVRLQGRNILTVGDADGFAVRGGMIRFVLAENKIRLRINLEAAKGANLTISSKLLRPAEIVAPGKD
jgi:YfiR/HmsC-like